MDPRSYRMPTVHRLCGLVLERMQEATVQQTMVLLQWAMMPTASAESIGRRKSVKSKQTCFLTNSARISLQDLVPSSDRLAWDTARPSRHCAARFDGAAWHDIHHLSTAQQQVSRGLCTQTFICIHIHICTVVGTAPLCSYSYRYRYRYSHSVVAVAALGHKKPRLTRELKLLKRNRWQLMRGRLSGN